MRILSKALIMFWVATLLVASTCFGADIHYCQGEAQTFGVYTTAKPCKMHKKKAEKKVRKCCMARKAVEQKPRHGFPILKNGKCCYNEQISFKTDGEQQQSNVEINNNVTLKAPQFEGVYIVSNSLKNDQKVATYRGPPDPHLVSNYQVFFQVFRI